MLEKVEDELYRLNTGSHRVGNVNLTTLDANVLWLPAAAPDTKCKAYQFECASGSLRDTRNLF